ncbi:type IX secretion system sortase PorU [Flavobacteriaceae bacterium TK19130]|nr:type IX secretion system sortase PorU [Thermobacterium salinum]
MPWEAYEPLPKNQRASRGMQQTDFAKNSNAKRVTSERNRAKDRLKLKLEGTIMFRDQWLDDGYAMKNSLQVSNIQYAPLTQREQSLIQASTIPSTPSFSISSSQARTELYTTVSATPIIRRNGRLEKITSFTISYSKQRSGSPMRMPIQNSVLATGEWFKFKVEETGVHRINKSFLDNLGMNTNTIDPRNIKIYGHGGKPLPLLLADNTQFDLPQTPIRVVGEEDGSFGNNDYILFYGISTKGYDEESETHLNPYSDDSYYYVTVSGGPGMRIQPMIQPSGAATATITTFNDAGFQEEDEYSPGKIGRRWFGNRFDIENDQTYEFDFPNIVSGSDMRVEVKVAGVSESQTSFSVTVNSTSLDPLTIAAIGEEVLQDNQRVYTIPAAGPSVSVNLTYNNNGNPSSVGYLDYVRVEALRQLTGTDSQILFENESVASQSGIAEYQFSNASAYSEIWDITNIESITSVSNEESASTISFKSTLGQEREFVAVHPSDYYQPIAITDPRVPNQNLKGTVLKDASGAFQDIDYLIVTAPFLLQPALRLANFHQTQSGLRVKVVTTDKIYEEFSSGKQDIGAIRNFVKYIYDNASSPDNRLQYIGFFGDASVDYKNRLPNNNNIVPTFQTVESVQDSDSFMTDDFYGCMDPNEGVMNGTEKLDIAVGRILADNVLLANQMVDKIISYTSDEAYGNWRNNLLIVSDDVDESWEFDALQKRLDSLGDEIVEEKPFVNLKKVHSDAFQQEASAGGNRYPEVNDRITEILEAGVLIMNYFGHGGEDGLSSERIFTKEMANNLNNKNRLPCIITITCEFTKFDLPSRITGGELTYWNPNGGAISLITTTRKIGAQLGSDINKAMAENLFGYGVEGSYPPAEALRRAKNGETRDSRRVVFYIGDPALPLAFPNQEIRLTSVNDQPIGLGSPPLPALGRVKMKGEVVDLNGNLLSNYQGVLEAKVFDKNVERRTLGNDGVLDAGQLAIMDFITLGQNLFNGQATIENGQFEFEFVMPRDTQIAVGNGRVSLYAKRNNQKEDHTGVNQSVRIGGLNEDAPEDNQGPNIQLFMNDDGFVSGGITNDSPALIAKLSDDNGINTASGVGHDIVAILDGDEANPFVLNEYYQADVDDFTRGIANYQLRDLEPGLHTLTLKAWDVYNNSNTSEIQFVVVGDDKLKIDNVLNYPNPFVNYTEFWFEHNRPNEPLEVQVQVFTVTGKLVWTRNQIVTTIGNRSRDITWDGRDDFGDRIGKGVYVYKITVKSTLTNKQTEKYEKLVIL